VGEAVTKTLTLTGKYAKKFKLVVQLSDEDYDRVREKCSWYAWPNRTETTFYAWGRLPRAEARRKGIDRTLNLHRFVLGAKKGQYVDHKDGNGLNCTRENLRLCSQSQNNANNKFRLGRSGFRGVQKSHSKWAAGICVNKKSHYLGVFDTPEDAARVYDDAAVLHFGEFARLNFPTEKSS
jgi:hypothetical protein